MIDVSLLALATIVAFVVGLLVGVGVVLRGGE